jgi:cytoskeletal protein CcmA (bactofilin family)
MADLSVISSSTVIRGNIQGDTSLRVDGRVRGDISVTGDVLIGPNAQVAGNITGATISISGAVEGDISGSAAVLIEKTGRVVGNLVANRIGIADGALVRGNVQTDASQAVSPGASFGSRSVSTPRPRAVAAAPRVEVPRAEAARVPARTERRPEPARPAPVKAATVSAPQAVKPVAAVAAAPIQPKLNLESHDAPRVEAGKLERKAPPPPVVSAPNKAVRGRKKVAKRL